MGVNLKKKINKIHSKMVKKQVKKIIKFNKQNREKVREAQDLWEGNQKFIGTWEYIEDKKHKNFVHLYSNTFTFDKYGNVKGNYEILNKYSGNLHKYLTSTEAKEGHYNRHC